MSTIQIKESIIDKLDLVDEQMLVAVEQILAVYVNGKSETTDVDADNIVGYEMDGRPISLEMLREDAVEGIREIRAGKGFSAEEVNKATEEWLDSIK